MLLEKLQQKKNIWHKCFVVTACALATIFLIYLASIEYIDMADNVLNLFFWGIILTFVVFAVMFLMYHKAYDAVVFKKRELGMSVKEEEKKKRFFSTPDPSWSEKSIKYLGCLMCLIAPLLIIGTYNDWFTALQSYFPRISDSHNGLMNIGTALIGVTAMKYHPEMSLLTRTFLWASIILLIVGFTLFLMGYEVGNWCFTLSLALNIISFFRAERELFFIEQE